ncbi:MAG: AI-2E family transporter [Elusimicrobiota bacterium]
MARRLPPKPPVWAYVVIALFIFAAYKVHDVLIPFALSLALAYLLNPVIHYFEVRGLRREFVVLSLYIVVTIAVTITANFLFPAVTREIRILKEKVPVYLTSLERTAEALKKQAAKRAPLGNAYIESMSFKMYDPITKQLPRLPTYVLGLFPLLSLIFLVPFITFFILMDSKKLLQELIQRCPSRYVEQVLHVVSEIDTALGNYIRGLLIIAGAVATASYMGLKFLRVDYALAISVLSGIASFIPYFGAVLGMVVGALVAFFQYFDYGISAQVVVLFIMIRLADEAFLQPLVARHSVHLHPMLFLLSLMVGGKVFGFVGLLFAVPTACVIKALIGVAWDWYVSEAQLGPPHSVEGAHIPFT